MLDELCRSWRSITDNSNNQRGIRPCVSVEDEIWREVALRQLLTLVDIPVLDGILSYEVTVPKVAKSDLAYSNLAFRRYESISSLLPSRWVYYSSRDKLVEYLDIFLFQVDDFCDFMRHVTDSPSLTNVVSTYSHNIILYEQLLFLHKKMHG